MKNVEFQTQEGDKDEINVDSAYLKSLRNEIRGCEEVIPEYVDYLQQTIRVIAFLSLRFFLFFIFK